MIVLDFQYDGLLLSDFGCMICNFDRGGRIETSSNGSQISFATTPILKGANFLLADTNYEECLTATFQICKNPCLYHGDDAYMNAEEVAELMRWLNRKSFHTLRLDTEGYERVYFKGSFNAEVVKVGSNVVGLSLNLTTNAPYGFGDTIYKKFIVTANQPVLFKDTSDEIGYIYPKTIITCNQSGQLVIENEIENRTCVIDNCTSGEVITLNYPTITSSLVSHNIADDFNYSFFRIANTWNNRVNKITVSLNCNFEISYNPICKIGM